MKMAYIRYILRGCEELGWDAEYSRDGNVERIKIKPFANVKFYYNCEPAVKALMQIGAEEYEAQDIVFNKIKFEGCLHFNTQIFWVEFSEIC